VRFTSRDLFVRAAAGLLFTMPGTPMVTYGDEIGMRGRFGEDGRRPMPWPAGDGTHGETWDEGLLAAYRDLAGLRRGSVALLRGGLLGVCRRRRPVSARGRGRALCTSCARRMTRCGSTRDLLGSLDSIVGSVAGS
jgi:hypothetical protein